MTAPSRVTVIPLHDRTGSVVAHVVIDATDAEWAGQWRWCLNPNGYAWRSATREGHAHVYLHRALAGATHGDGMYADHINRDRLDCRRANLRLLTPAQAAQNKPALRGQYRGVSWDPERERWVAHAQLDRRYHFIGRYASEEEAGQAAEAWRRQHMPFAVEDVA